jgi:Global regulator protein family
VITTPAGPGPYVIEVVPVQIRGHAGNVRLGFVANFDIKIVRKELLEQDRLESLRAGPEPEPGDSLPGEVYIDEGEDEELKDFESRVD